MGKNIFQHAKSMEDVHVEYRNHCQEMEQARDEIARDITRIETDQGQCEILDREMQAFFQRTDTMIEDAEFMHTMSDCEYDLRDYSRKTEHALEEKKKSSINMVFLKNEIHLEEHHEFNHAFGVRNRTIE